MEGGGEERERGVDRSRDRFPREFRLEFTNEFLFFFLNWGDGIWMVTSRTGDGRGVGERERG